MEDFINNAAGGHYLRRGKQRATCYIALVIIVSVLLAVIYITHIVGYVGWWRYSRPFTGLAKNMFSWPSQPTVRYKVVMEDIWKSSGYVGCVNQTMIDKRSTAPLAAAASGELRILCWVYTREENAHTRLKYVMQTWLRGCDALLLVAEERLKVPDVPMPVEVEVITTDPSRNFSRGRTSLSTRSEAAWSYVYAKYWHRMHFFIKADDDTYVVMANLRAFLRDKNPDFPGYYGNVMCEPTEGVLFNSGGAAYVLSRGALAKFIPRLTSPAGKKCHPPGFGEDWKTGLCLREAGVLPYDTTDWRGRERFIPERLAGTLLGDYYRGLARFWTQDSIIRQGVNCCSDKPISFHRVRGADQLLFSYAFDAKP